MTEQELRLLQKGLLREKYVKIRKTEQKRETTESREKDMEGDYLIMRHAPCVRHLLK